MLLAADADTRSILIEHDEDIELQIIEHHVYIQVKHLTAPLRLSDVARALERFQILHREHNTGPRDGGVRCFIVSSSEPGSQLLKATENDSWPSYVSLLSPSTASACPAFLPPAWRSVAEGFHWCAARARALPFSTLAPDTLVYKLAGYVQRVATGAAPWTDHRIATNEVHELFEEITRQFHHFPDAPDTYRQHEGEPDYCSSQRVRLITGVAGSGKTSWATQAALQLDGLIAYYDVAAGEETVVTSGIVHEIGSMLIAKRSDERIAKTLSGRSSLELLHVLDEAIASLDDHVTLFIDNAHRVQADDVRRVIEAMPSVSYILLIQPGAAQIELEAIVDIRAEVLAGWAPQTIAAEFAQLGCAIDPTTAQRVQQLTGGLPLYVHDFAVLTRDQYQCQAAWFCDDLEALGHTKTIAQQVVLRRVIGGLTIPELHAFGLLGLSDVPLTRAEVLAIFSSALGFVSQQSGQIIRRLVAVGCVITFGPERIRIHDAFRIVAAEHRVMMEAGVIMVAQMTLLELLHHSLVQEHSVQRLRQYLRLLSATGGIETLVNLAGEEFLHEWGMPDAIRSVIKQAIDAAALAGDDFFWAVNTLCFWDIQSDEYAAAMDHLSTMEGLLRCTDATAQQRLSYLCKKMITLAHAGDATTVHQLAAVALQLTESGSGARRIVKHNYATALFRLPDLDACKEQGVELISEYMQLLGLTRDDLIGVSASDLLTRFEAFEHRRLELKHLADAFTLVAAAEHRQIGSSSITWLFRLQAVKLYGVIGASTSVLRFGQDLVDDFLSIHEPDSARRFIEQVLLSILDERVFPQWEVPIRGQYAVVLACCGAGTAAISELERLRPFVRSLTQEQRTVFDTQCQLVRDALAE